MPTSQGHCPPPPWRPADHEPAALDTYILEQAHAERFQQRAKGYTAAHDDTHNRGELADAAAFVAAGGAVSIGGLGDCWGKYVMQKHDRRSALIIAIAWLTAEVARLDRMADAGKEPA
jgi:hypothetical protein